MQKLLETLKEDFLVVTVSKNAVYESATRLDGNIIINEYYNDKAFETVLNNLPDCLYDKLSHLEINNS